MSLWKEIINANSIKREPNKKQNNTLIFTRDNRRIITPAVIHSSHKTVNKVSALFIFLLFATALIAKGVEASQINVIPEWRPQSSEKLVKLPSTYLKKSIDSDFAESQLGKAIESNKAEGKLKVRSLSDLKDAVNQSEGGLKTELRHQLLAEKQAYIKIISRKNKLRWKQLMTKQRLFERMLKKIAERSDSMTSSKRILIENQGDANKRFEATVSKVDLQLFETNAIPESTYSRKYSANMAVINRLLSKVSNHRMNKAIKVNGRSLSKQEYIQQLLTDTQSEISILEQEETILAYMAKLVALDSLTLSEEALDESFSQREEELSEGPAEAADLFLSN